MHEHQPRRVALYARVSTPDQHPEIQLHDLRRYAEVRGFKVEAEFVDHGVSGTRGNRPALDQLLAGARRRDFDVVVCTKLDRLGRSVRHLVNMTAEFEALGVDLVVVDQGIDTTTPAGRLLFHVLGSIAEFEGDLIRERVSAGMKAAKRRGAKMGRPRALDAEGRRRVRRLRASGHSIRKIASTVGVGQGTVARAIAEAE